MLPERQAHHEGRSLPRSAVSGDVIAVTRGDSLADREPDSGSIVVTASVKPLESSEHPFAVLFVEANPVVFDEDQALLGAPSGGTGLLGRRLDDPAVYLHDRRLALAPELE